MDPNGTTVAEAERRRAKPSAPVVLANLVARPVTVDLAGRTVPTWAFADVIGGPGLRAKAGDVLAVSFRNELPVETTIHWHGIALRNDMDGVHDLTQLAVKPGATFEYRFTVADPGTYWFHPHTGLQLDRGLYSPLIIDDPADPGAYDAESIIVLDDWLDGLAGRTPEMVFAKLKPAGGGIGDMSGMARSNLLGGDAGDARYAMHLVNGRPPGDRPTFDVLPSGRLRLRVINAGSDTAYRFCVGGHRMTVTHTDGFPVEVDTILIGMGERHDVVVTVRDGAWPFVALAEGKNDAAEAVIRTKGSIQTAPSWSSLGERAVAYSARSNGNDHDAAIEGADLDHVTGTRGLHDLVVADVHAHVTEVDVEENQVARLQLIDRHSRKGTRLRAGVVDHGNARFGPRPLGQS